MKKDKFQSKYVVSLTKLKKDISIRKTHCYLKAEAGVFNTELKEAS